MKKKQKKTKKSIKEITEKINKCINNEYDNLSFFPFDLIKGSFRHINFIQRLIKNITIYNSDIFYTETFKNYTKFLNLIKCYKQESVPTFAIDIIWHTHIKNHLEYKQYTAILLGHMLNHNDNITNIHSKKIYAKTCLNWSELYHEKYSDEVPDYTYLTNFCLPNFKITRLKKLYKNNPKNCSCLQNQPYNKTYYNTIIPNIDFFNY